ncbi:hypothetical protein GPECTOR_101g32 [Gonium pectorale]|uniref:Endonuclease/exonuclease/phosphatase domain-containing protein n=1 Tax=Gonium pectorale TaxID=33097 RepID=A0A150FZY0_GONPE|nr:hypothetical protein GPECTOR_101g32 [Gonium pectorale]|eukprot:KXZ43131.1 hypothetical protein GPECTOR_101g32 [Gonium pectorale]
MVGCTAPRPRPSRSDPYWVHDALTWPRLPEGVATEAEVRACLLEALTAAAGEAAAAAALEDTRIVLFGRPGAPTGAEVHGLTPEALSTIFRANRELRARSLLPLDCLTAPGRRAAEVALAAAAAAEAAAREVVTAAEAVLAEAKMAVDIAERSPAPRGQTKRVVVDGAQAKVKAANSGLRQQAKTDLAAKQATLAAAREAHTAATAATIAMGSGAEAGGSAQDGGGGDHGGGAGPSGGDGAAIKGAAGAGARDLRVLLWNARGLTPAKLREPAFLRLAARHDLLVVTETHCGPSCPAAALHLPGFHHWQVTK